MNDLQQKEFELLKLFINICDELNLKYFLVCGSALGAVKYKGFIPWDDDIDVALPINDYEIFISKAQEFLPENIFLQNYKTDPAFPQIFSKLRDSNTTYIEKTVAKLPINHGIYIDIFPLDGYPKELMLQRKLEKIKTKYKRQLSCTFEVDRSLAGKIICLFNKMIGCHKKTNIIAGKYDRIISAFSVCESDLLCNHGNWQGKLEYAPKWHYGDGIWMTFEGLKVRVPENYNSYLIQKYGNWKADLPESEKVGHHYYNILDCYNSYTKYI